MSAVQKKCKDVSTYLSDLEITEFDHKKWQDTRQNTTSFSCVHFVL